MGGLRCCKMLWLLVNRPTLAAAVDNQTSHLFDLGHKIESYAWKLFPDGVSLINGTQINFSQRLIATDKAIHGKALYLFEASFAAENAYCRADVLERVEAIKWNIKEIKMSSHLKSEHAEDIAFQIYCMQQTGQKIERASLIHINNQYVRFGDIQPEKLFIEEDVTDEVNARLPYVQIKLQALINMVAAPEPPHGCIGTQCKVPGRCVFFDFCYKNIPADSIYELPNGLSKIQILESMGIHLLKDIPQDFKLTERQSAYVQSAKTGKPVVDVLKIGEFLKSLEYPLYFLDFETVNPVVPPFDNCSPYQVSPFQYSLHIQQNQGGELKHYEFLPYDADDPRKALLEDLVSHVGDRGSLISWNMSFEKKVLLGLAAKYSEFARIIDSWQSRFRDLIIPFRGGTYSDHRFKGSVSLKSVLPVMVPSMSYENLTIQHGDDASLFYQEYVEGKIPQSEWLKLHPDMIAYCERDTFGMVAILDELYKVAGNYQVKEVKI